MPSHKAILTGYNWNSEPTLAPQRTPIFLTYSFAADTFWGYKRFNAADKKVAKYALKQWGDACGIRFIETKSEDAEIKFSWFTDDYTTTVAYAGFPELYTPTDYAPGEVLERDFLAGHVRFNTAFKDDLSNKSYKTYVMLHEIGHALGLKHPFHKSPYNKKKLSKADDHSKNTVMSYDNGESKVYPTKLRKLDKQAIKELYGSSKSDGTHVSSWSWNKKAQTLTQIAKEGEDRIHGTGVRDIINGLGGNDRLFGHDGNDTLYGSTGNDTLGGGDGADTFVFDTALDATSNVDKIAGFDENDSIILSSAVFTKLSLGLLSSESFSNTGTAKDATDYLVFDRDTRLLYYDADGSGAGEKVPFAKIMKSWKYDPEYLNAYDFHIV